MTNYNYIWKTNPYKHQAEAMEQMFGKPAFGLFCEMGTGKSKMLVDEIVNLYSQGLLNIAIIIAPNQLHETWVDQFMTHAPDTFLEKICVQTYYSSLGKRQENITRKFLQSGKLLVFVINIEAISTEYGFTYIQRLLMAKRRSYLVIDESHKIKTPGAKRTKHAIKLGEIAMFKRIATGTEISEGIHELYSQMRFLDPDIIGSKSFAAFKGMYCITRDIPGEGVRKPGQIIVGYHNQDDLAKKIAPHVFQIRKDQCLDLPEQTYILHPIKMTVEQTRIYNDLEEELLVELEDGTLIDVTVAIARIMRLQQVVCGHIANNFIPSNRAKYVSEIVEETSGKTIIFARFQNDVNIMLEELKDVAVGFHGGYGVKIRDEIITDWRQDKSIKALVMTGSTGGLGLTLNEANSTIFYSNSWSATDRYQCESRNHRIGQNDKVTYHDIIVKGTIDEVLLRTLRRKQSLANQFRTILDVKRMLLGVRRGAELIERYANVGN
jgi:SNF2 family DNA or RNA helicase